MVQPYIEKSDFGKAARLAMKDEALFLGQYGSFISSTVYYFKTEYC